MRINTTQNFNTFTKFSSRKNTEEKKTNPIQFKYNSSDIQSNYNIAFMRKKPANTIFADARILPYNIIMEPNKEYLIDEDSTLQVADTVIDLHSDEMRSKISQLKNGDSFVIGREAFAPQNITKRVSRQHLRISKQPMDS